MKLPGPKKHKVPKSERHTRLEMPNLVVVSLVPARCYTRHKWCGGLQLTYKVPHDELDNMFYPALNQPSLNCQGPNRTKATSQTQRKSSRSQQLRHGISIFRMCQEGLHTGRSAHRRWSSFESRNMLICVSVQKRESWVGATNDESCDCTCVIVTWCDH